MSCLIIGMRPVQSLVKQIQLILQEYLASGDVSEAQRCLKELEVNRRNYLLNKPIVERVNVVFLVNLCFFNLRIIQKDIGYWQFVCS